MRLMRVIMNGEKMKSAPGFLPSETTVQMKHFQNGFWMR